MMDDSPSIQISAPGMNGIVFDPNKKDGSFPNPNPGAIQKAKDVFDDLHSLAGLESEWIFETQLMCKIDNNLVKKGHWDWSFKMDFKNKKVNITAPKAKWTKAP